MLKLLLADAGLHRQIGRVSGEEGKGEEKESERSLLHGRESLYDHQAARTLTILPVTPPPPRMSWARLASVRGSRCAISGSILRCRRRSNSAVRSWRNHAGRTRFSHWML